MLPSLVFFLLSTALTGLESLAYATDKRNAFKRRTNEVTLDQFIIYPYFFNVNKMLNMVYVVIL